MGRCSSEWKDEEARGIVSQASPRCRYIPEWIVRGQFVTGCPADYFPAEKRGGGRKKKKHYSSTAWPCCSYNEGPACLHPPLLSWPTPKSHRVIELHYCSKISVAGRPASCGNRACQLLPPTVTHPIRMPACHTGEDDRGANITRRSSHCRRVIQTQYKQMMGVKVRMNTGGQKAIFPSKSIFWW